MGGAAQPVSVFEESNTPARLPEQTQGKEESAKVPGIVPTNVSLSTTNDSTIEVSIQRKEPRAIGYEMNDLNDKCAKSSVVLQPAAIVMEEASTPAKLAGESPREGIAANVSVDPSPVSPSEDATAVDVSILRKELRGAHNELDYVLLVLFLAGVSFLADGMTLVRQTGVGFGAAVGAVWWLGALDRRGAMILLINVVILVPFNIGNFVFYWVSYPLRMLCYQALQFIMIPLFSGFKSYKPFKDATFAEMLRVMPHFFNFLMTGLDPKYRPFGDNIDDATSDQARDAMTHAPIFQLLRDVMANVPKGFLNSVVFRLIVQMCILTTLGWWWAGWCYIPLMPLRPEEEGEDVPPPLPPVQIEFTKCKWLKIARDSFGEDIGKAKCVNE